MLLSKAMTGTGADDITALIARKVMTTRNSIFSFADFSTFFAELLKTQYKPASRLITCGHVTPDVELAANRAEIELIEVLGPSPFSSDIQNVLKIISSPHDIVYVANPNKITGAHFAVSDLERLARTVPQGTLIVDEYYYDFYGISAFPLVDLLTNVIIIRSFTSSFGVTSSDSGFILAAPETINIVKSSILEKPFSSTMRKTIYTTLVNEKELSQHLHHIHEESLRVATALNRLHVQCRITATDFILLRVADPTQVGNFLASYKTPVDNLDGYPQLKHYMRYRLQSPYSNDRLLEAFKKMPPAYYRMKTLDRRAVTLRSGQKEYPTKQDQAQKVTERKRTRVEELTSTPVKKSPEVAEIK